MSKKSYMSLLKEAIAEFDTSDHLDVKGPMLDPILSWEGDGELPIYKDAASILERYYFNEDNDKGVETMDEGELQADYQNDKGSAGGESMKNAEGTGTEQAGTSDSDTIAGAKKDKEKDIAKEGLQREQDDDDDDDEEVVDESTEMENAIIEKLISEMEDDDDDDDEKEEVEEAEVMNYTGDGPKEEAPKEKKASGPEEDTHGAGTEQAGTGPDEGQIPPRKDIHDKLVKPKEYTDENTMIEAALAELEREIAEQDEMPAPDGDEGGDDEDKDLDVDKKMKEQAPAPSAVPGGPGPKNKGEDVDDDEAAYSEAFKLFKEAIEDDDEDEEKEED
jgi:hypothetical protein